MFKNYLKIAVRNLLRSKGYSIINISGLAIGMASALLIMLWVSNEFSYDRWFSKTDRIYRLYNRDKFDGALWAWGNTPKVIAPTLRQGYPEVEEAVRFTQITFLSTVGETRVNERGGFADSAFLKVFDFPMISGDRNRALDGTYNIVLTQKFAKTLFGNQDPMGKTVRIDSNANFVVTGVLKDLPSNTAFDFAYILPWSFMHRLGWDDQYWGNNSVSTYVLLKPGVKQASFDDRIRDITTSHSKETAKVFTQPLARMHLYGKSVNGQLVGDRIRIVQLFSVIAGFILLIACINFMNLSTARSEKRAKEVGIRKVVGAVKGLLIAQFIGESILLCFLGFFVALFLVNISLSGFNTLVGKELMIQYSDPKLWLFSLGFILLTGILAGSYPAFYLSSFRPASVLKGAFKKPNALITPRKLLVILQFSFAIILIICTLIIRSQIQYGQDRDPGYNRNNLIYTFTQGDIPQHFDAIKQDLLSSGAAIAVNKSAGPITQQWSDGWGYSWEGSTPQDAKTDFVWLGTDADFVKTMGATLIQGRDIDIYKYATDSNAIMLNESAVKAMRLKNPIGQIVSRSGEPAKHVVGVIKDFILESPWERKVSPMVINGPDRFFQVIHVKLNPAVSSNVSVAKVETVFKRYNPNYPFAAIFVDENYAKKFKDEQRIGRLTALFAGLTIFISCLGLFALATYMAENRVKEIGVRKVLGASVGSITSLLARDFIKLVVIAFVIAAPIAWFAMNKWLQGYDYRIGIGWTVFALSGILSILIAIITVSYQSIKAAMANPVKNLRSE